MPTISPSINIGIGDYGATCLNDLASNFCLRENQYVDYVSFHQLNIVDGRISMHNFKFEKEIFQEYKVSSKGASDTEEESPAWQLHNFISQAYNSLITLKNKLARNVNFHAIHINIIFAAYEVEHLELLKETILLINQLKKQGNFGEVRVKCFSILSDGEGVATPMQEENIVRTLDSIVEIRKKYDVLSHNFVLDDKNTQAVSLKVTDNYHAFAISEIIVALIRNENAMLGALHNKSGVVSIGIGMVYFDTHYFQAFIKNRILESKLKIEKIHGEKTKISTSKYTDAVQNTLLPYIENKIEIDIVVKDIQEAVAPGSFEGTLGCYEFLLTNILGEHDRVALVDPIEADELYSINDLIYHLLYQQVISDEDKEQKGLLNLKKYKDNLTEYNAKLRDKIDASESEMMDEHQALEKHEEAVKELIQHYANRTWREKIVPIRNAKSVEKDIEQAKINQKKEKDEFNKKNVIKKFCGRRKYEEQKKESQVFIQNLEKEKEARKQNNLNLVSDLNKLYALKAETENLLKALDKGIKDLHSLKINYQTRINSLPYLDFEFIQNVISDKKLIAYEKNHRIELQSGIDKVIGILYQETNQTKANFISLIDAEISKSTNGIIDFKMTRHLLNEYDTMNLLIPIKFDDDLKKLKHRSLPFFNAIPTYTNKSHYLKYYNNSNKERTDEIQDLMEGNYTGSLPSTIHADSENKFALITIEVIEDLKSIVKYNNHHLKTSSK